MALAIGENQKIQSIDWAGIDTVLLDMDGTLLDLQFDNTFWLHTVPKRYAELNHLTYDGAYRRLCSRKIRGYKQFGRWWVYTSQRGV